MSARRCGLCDHEMTMDRCGFGAVKGVFLCHTDDHDCYRRWTVYGERRDGHRSIVGYEAHLANDAALELARSWTTGDNAYTASQQGRVMRALVELVDHLRTLASRAR